VGKIAIEKGVPIGMPFFIFDHSLNFPFPKNQNHQAFQIALRNFVD